MKSDYVKLDAPKIIPHIDTMASRLVVINHEIDKAIVSMHQVCRREGLQMQPGITLEFRLVGVAHVID